MKKLLLLGAVGLSWAAVGAQETYYQGLPVNSLDDLTTGRYMISAVTNLDEGMVKASDSFIGNITSNTKSLAAGTTDAAFVWDIVKNEDNTITIKNVGTDKYIPYLGSTSGTKGNINGGTTDVAQAATFQLNNISNDNISFTNYGKRWALVKTNNNGSDQNVHVHCNGSAGSFHFSYWPGGANHGTGSAIAATFYHVSDTELPTAQVTFNLPDNLSASVSLPVGYTIGTDVSTATSDNVVRGVVAPYSPWCVIPNLSQEIVVAEGGNSVDITVDWGLPIVANTPYRVKLRATDNSPHPVYYTGSVGTIREHASVANELNPNSLWYFKSTGYESGKGFGFTMHSLSADDEQGMQVTAANSNTGISLTSEPTKFYILKSTFGSAQATDFCLRAEGGDNWYVNEYNGNNNSGKNFAIWAHNDARGNDGSVMRVVALTDADFDNYQSWTTTDGITKYFEPNAKAAAKASKSVADLRTLFTTVVTDMTYGQACDALTAYSATKVSKLTATTLFTEAEAQAVIAAAASIDENAENFETALAEAKALVDAIDVNVEATKKMNGRKVIIRNIAGANGTSNLNYITGVATGETVNTALLSPAAVWTVAVNDDNTFVLRNLVKENYLGNLQAADEGVAFRLANNGVSSNNANAFAIQNPSQSGNNFLNNNATTNETLRYFGAGSGNASSFWTIAFADEQEAAWLEAATANYVAGIETGNEPGKYVVSDPDYAAKAALCAQVQVDGEVNYPVLAQLVENPISGEAPALFDIHSITGPALVRIKDFEGKYMLAGKSFANLNEGDDQTASYFVLENENGVAHIATYNGGHYLTPNGDALSIHTGESAANNTAAPVQFLRNYIPAYVPAGKYGFGYVGGNNKKAIFASVSGNFNQYTSGAGADYRTDIANAHVGFEVEYVKSLNLSFDSYTLWRTPVAVKFVGVPDAYTVKATGSTITTVAVDSESEYAAGTAFFLNGQIELQVLNNVTEAAAVDGIVGHHAIKAHTVAANKVVLTVAPASADTPAMLADEPVLPTVKMAVEIPTEDEVRTLAAHNVLLVADNADQGPLKHGDELAVALGGDTTTTGIFEVNADNAAAEGAVYDLQGRRLAAPVKGINIINGKKVLVK